MDVTVNGIPAPLYSVSANPVQISAVVPFSATGSVATVVVTVPLGTGGDFAAPITRRVMEAYFFR